MNASSLILAHNHPSGSAEPSKADKIITERVVKCCQFMDVRGLDHVVIGRGEYVSFAERGWIYRTLRDPSGSLAVLYLSTSLTERILRHL